VIEENKYIIADIMSKNLIAVGPKATAKSASETMIKNEIGSLVVKENGEVVGIITDRDFAKAALTNRDVSKAKVGELMSTNLVHVDSKLSLQEAVSVIRKHKIRHLLVKSPSGIVGIVSVRDILSTLIEEITEQNTTLNQKIGELEKFYKIAIDRELIMVKLKKRIHELEEKTGEKSNFAEFLS
jgi:CBS domain-containing protein